MNNFFQKLLNDKWLLQTILQPVSAFLFLLVIFVFYLDNHPDGFFGAVYSAYFEEWPLLYMSSSLLVTTFLFTYDEQPTQNTTIIIGFFSIFFLLITAAIIGASSSYSNIAIIIVSLLLYLIAFLVFAYMANKNSNYFNRKRREFTKNDTDAKGEFGDVEV